jgi:YVTN family beta-propeller protein
MRRLSSPYKFRIGISFFVGFLGAAAGWAQPYLHPPSVNTYARHDPAGITILPNGRFIRPEGKSIPLARFPHGLAMSRDGKQLFVPSDGVGQILTDWQSGAPKIVQLNPPKPPKKNGHLNAGGAEFSPDGARLYWSSGDRGTLLVFDAASAHLLAEIPLNVEIGGKKFEDSYAADVRISADGRYLYCADVTNFRLAVVDTGERRVVGSTPVGRYPYALTVSGSRVFVANIGLFEYSAIPAPGDNKSDPRGLPSRPSAIRAKRRARA